MAEAKNSERTGTARYNFWPLLGALGVVALALWLTADQEVVALVSPHDDQFFMQRAECGYWFDQGYTQFSFIKDPIYPLFGWIWFRLGINLRLATAASYLAAAGFFSWSLVRRRSHGGVGLLVFAACALHPMQFAVFQQTTADALYPTLLLLVLGALLVQFQEAGRPGWWRHGLFSGLALGLLWNTRPERPLAGLLLLFFLAVGGYTAWRQAPTWKVAFGQWLRAWALVPAVLALTALTIPTANYVRFGVFATSDLQAPGFWSAYQALTSIRPQRSLRLVSVTREARLQAYAVSPSFRQLQPYLEGNVGEKYASFGRRLYALPPGELAGGWFWWAVRDATAAAGHCRSAEEAEAFYRQIAEELQTAVRAGTLDSRVVLPAGFDPNPENYLPYLPGSAANLWQRCWSPDEPEPLHDHANDIRQFFDTVANRRPLPAGPTAQADVRSWLWWMYGPVLQVVLLIGALLAALVLQHDTPGRGWYFFVALALGLAGCSRLGLFALMDASAFPGAQLRYLFPVALAFAALAVWLTAEGLRLLRAGRNTVPSCTPTCAESQLPHPTKTSGSVASWPMALLGLFLVVFALVALSSPGRIDIVDGQTRYEVARSLVDHGDSVIRDKGAWFAVLPGRDGQRYANYRFPHSGLGVVAIWLADATGPTEEARRQFFFTLICPFAAAVLALSYAVWFRSLGLSPWASIAWASAGIFCTPNWFYATSTFDDLLAATAGVTAVAIPFLCRERRPMLGAVAAGLLLALAFNVKPPMGVFVFPVLAASYRAQLPLRRQLIPMAIVLVGLALGFLAYTAYERFKFPPGTGDAAETAEALFGPVWTGDPLPGLASLAASPSAGALWYCPTLLLSFAGWLRWRHKHRLFCGAVLLSSLGFTVFLSFLFFFKGEPSWGPRYLTPVFALWWLFAPCAVDCMRRTLVCAILALGCLVQLLALSVDPQRLFLTQGIPSNYYCEYPWLGFNPAIAHLWQRPREIVEVCTPHDTVAAAFSPAPLPTHAGCITIAPPLTTSVVGLMAAAQAPGPLNGAVSLWPASAVQHAVFSKFVSSRYHIFDAPRPWVISLWYLAEDARPVDLARTIGLLAALGLGGFAFAFAGASRSSRSLLPRTR
jgi:hypothetical protein